MIKEDPFIKPLNLEKMEMQMVKTWIGKFTTCLILIFLFGFPAVCRSAEPIKITAIYSLTGNGAFSNRPSVLGVRIAVDEINRTGGLLGRKINLVILDNMSTPIGSSLAANQAVASGTDAIIGAAWSSHSIAIAQVAQKNRIPMISNFSTSPKLTRIGNYIFRVCYTDKFQGKIMAEFARTELKAKTAIVFVDLTSDFSLDLSHIFQGHFKAMGGQILREIDYKADQKTYTTQIRQAAAQKADVVFLSGHDESGTIAAQLQKAGVQSIPIGGDGWDAQSFFLFGGNQLKQGYYCSHWSQSSERKVSKRFAALYKHKPYFGVGSALAYDAVMVLASAIKKAGVVDREKIRNSLQHLDSYDGVTGTIKFDANGDPVKSVVLMQIVNGKPVYLKSLAPLDVLSNDNN